MADAEKHEMYGTLSQIEEAFLRQGRFIKPHRSYIVNMDYVRRLYDHGLIMADGGRVPVPRANYSEVKRRYIAYFFGRGAVHDKL